MLLWFPPADGCFLATEGEVDVFVLEGEAIILSCPIFDRVLEVRNIAPPNANYIITKDNGTEGVSFQGEGRVQQRDKQLRFLPAQASDSGLYICTYRYALRKDISLSCTDMIFTLKRTYYVHFQVYISM